MPQAYIGVGSNLGDRPLMIQHAQVLMHERGISVTRVSPLYETEALCKPGQSMPPFINGVFEIETKLSPHELLKTLQEMERKMGRTQKGDWQPRPIDLDILFYERQIICSDDLMIPHPEIQKRWFVLKPLADLVPNMIHPVLKKTIKEILCNFSSILPT